MKIEEKILHIFVSNGWTLSTAESCTGGGIAACLTKIPGASDYFLGGVIAYGNDLKKRLLNVPKEILKKHGAVSEETVLAMVSGALAITESDYAVAISGIAGPAGGTKEKPVGTVWLAIAQKEREAQTWRLQGVGNRSEIIEWSILEALDKLLAYASMCKP